MIIMKNKIYAFAPSHDIAYISNNIESRRFRMYNLGSFLMRYIPEDLIIAKLNTYNLEKSKWAKTYVAELYRFIYNKGLPVKVYSK